MNKVSYKKAELAYLLFKIYYKILDTNKKGASADAKYIHFSYA